MTKVRFLKQPSRLEKWPIKPTEIVLFLCFALGIVVVLTGLLVKGYEQVSGESYNEESLAFGIASGLGLHIGSLLAWLLLKCSNPETKNEKRNGAGRSILVGIGYLILAYLILIPITFSWKSLLDYFEIEYELQAPVTMIMKGGTPLEMSLMVILAVIIAPVSEELVYRGVLYRYLHQRLPEIVAILIPTVLWSWIHQSLYSFVPLIFLGYAISLAYRNTGNILSSITFHVLFNAINFGALFYELE